MGGEGRLVDRDSIVKPTCRVENKVDIRVKSKVKKTLDLRLVKNARRYSWKRSVDCPAGVAGLVLCANRKGVKGKEVKLIGSLYLFSYSFFFM